MDAVWSGVVLEVNSCYVRSRFCSFQGVPCISLALPALSSQPDTWDLDGMEHTDIQVYEENIPRVTRYLAIIVI